MAIEWVDFRKVKEAVDFQRLLDHYGITNMTRHGDELRGPCPVHKGNARTKHFTVNLRKNAFKCFFVGCEVHKGGNVLDFVAAMEHCSVRDAALKLAEWFKIGESESPSKESEHAAPDVSRGIYTDPGGDLFEVVATALSGEDSERLVVYRELSGEYQFRLAPPENFGEVDCRFTLVKAL
jgi:hypothetical protein